MVIMVKGSIRLKNLKIVVRSKKPEFFFYFFFKNNATYTIFLQQILKSKLLLVGEKVMSIVAKIKTNNNLPHKFYYENVVDVIFF